MSHQLDLDFAQRRADAGIAASAAHADSAEPGWVDLAVEAVRDYVLRHARWSDEPSEFTIERVRMFMSSVPEPPDARAWGAVTRRAVRLRVIEETGRYAPAASSNGSPKRLYRRGSGA